VDGRDHATAALTVMLAEAGVWCVRVHDVRASHDVLAVREAWQEARQAAEQGVTGEEQA
jgi:dihydropteroate synthase